MYCNNPNYAVFKATHDAHGEGLGSVLGYRVLTTVIELLLLEYYGCGDTEMTQSV